MRRWIRTRTFLTALCSSLLLSALVAAWIGLQLGGTTTTLWVDDCAGAITAALACAACLGARRRHAGRARTFWLLLSCATGLWAAAEVTWAVYALGLQEAVPSPSVADVGYLLAVPIALAALMIHPSIGAGDRRARSLLDSMVVAAAVLFLGWTLVIGPIWRSSNMGSASAIVTISYPVTDVMLVTLAVITLRRMTGANRRSLGCLAGALVTMALFDGAYAYLTEVAQYSSATANMIDAGWVLAYLGIALSALFSRPEEIAQPDLAASRTAPLVSLVAPLVPVLMALAVIAIESGLGHHQDHTARAIAGALIGLVLLRQLLLLRELVGSRSRSDVGLARRINDAAGGASVLGGPR
jgi:hypothetical protein